MAMNMHTTSLLQGILREFKQLLDAIHSFFYSSFQTCSRFIFPSDRGIASKEGKAIQHKWDELVDTLDANEIIDSLYTKNCITDLEYDSIRLETRRREKTRELLRIIQKTCPKSFDQFVETLEENYDFLAVELRSALRNDDHSD